MEQEYKTFEERHKEQIEHDRLILSRILKASTCEEVERLVRSIPQARPMSRIMHCLKDGNYNNPAIKAWVAKNNWLSGSSKRDSEIRWI